jgi:hypothetical protein
MQTPLARRLALAGVAVALGGVALFALRDVGAAPPRPGEGEAGQGPVLRPERPPLVESVGRWQGCRPVAYGGPKTRLYSDRPYHTEAGVPALRGRVFCRGPRHGRASWLLHVARPTTLHAVANEDFGLEGAGWRRLDGAAVRVAAAGASLDRLYALDVGPGHFLIHQDHAATSIPVFWNPRDARIIGPPALR